MDRRLVRTGREWAVLVLFALWAMAGSALAQTEVTNTAYLSPPTGWRCATPNEQGNCDVAASVTNQVGSPQLVIAKTTAATQLVVGGTVSYTLQVRNTGNLATTGTITVRDSLPAGLNHVSASGTGWSCSAASNVITCSRTAAVAAAAPAPPITVIANVLPAALPQVINTATVGGGGDARCPTESPNAQVCGSSVTTPVVQPAATSVNKTVDKTGPVNPNDTLTYTVTTVVSGSALTQDLTLADTLGAGQTFGSVTTPGSYTCNGSLTCVLPAGTLPGSYPLVYTTTVNANATGTVGNSVAATNPPGGDPDPVCGTCSTDVPVVAAAISVNKTVDKTGPVNPNDTLTYTVTTVVSGSALTQDLTLVDTLSGNQTFGSVTAPGAYTCNGSLTCVLPAGTLPGSYPLVYTTKVNANATGTVGNSVAATNPPGGDPDPVCGTCSTDVPVVAAAISVNKTVDKTGPVNPNDTLTYTVTAVVSGSALTQDLTLADTLGAGQTFGSVTAPGAYTCNGSLTCVLPAGTLPGSYPLVYTTKVNANATGTVGNSVAATNPPGGDPDPVCGTCSTDVPVVAAAISVNKTVDKTGPVNPNDTLTYTVTAVVSGSALTQDLTLVDTLSGNQTFGSVTAPGAYTCNGSLTCVLPAGTLPGSYPVVYTTTVDADATGTVGNSVVASGGDPECVSCTTNTPVVKSVARVSKSVAQTQAVRPGDLLDFTLLLTLEQAANAGPISLIDTLGEGLEFVTVTNAGAFSCSRELTCILAAGHLPGQYTVTYQARVAANAGTEVRNSVVAIEQDPNTTTPSLPGDPGQPLCETCQTITPVAREVNLRISKVAAVREARIGDLVRYTLEVENLGDANLVNGVVIDTAPAGFSLVAGSLVVIDGDNAAQVSSGSPTRFTGIDIAAGQKAQLVYLMRVGAGVRNGVQVNRAQVRDVDGNVLSNEASAQVTIAGDPLLEDSLLLGTVFDDRNGDGRQASARLSEVFVQGGFDPQAYIANSTTIERDGVREPLADASSPLLHGVAVGTLVGRSSSADNGQAGTVVIRQRLREPAFTGGFALRSRQGLGLTLAADGQASISRQGDAADGLSSAELQVERRVSPVADGVEVAYVIRNTGIDERGIPGVRIASVEGLLMETDQFGRYHLVGISAGEQARGRNHVLKVDPSTLPAGAQFTTDNPLLRRITPGMPARFDFGVRLPAEQVGGRNEQVELEMGQVLFAPGASSLQPQYLPVIEQVAERVRSYDGGEVVIAADGEGQVLAMARAEAVQQALQQALGAELSGKVQVQVRSKADQAASTVVGLHGEDLLLGSVLFDTDKSDIKPEFEALLDAVAARLQQRRGGTVAIVGHTDVRGSHAYNAALGLRRARAVHEALMRRLSPDVRDNVRVDASSDTTAPIDAGRE